MPDAGTTDGRAGTRTGQPGGIAAGAGTVAQLVASVQARLGALADPRAESLELVAALLDVPRHWPALNAAELVDESTERRALLAARKYAAGAPLAYAVGTANFRNLTLSVDERVLIPRPETELLVELVVRRVTSRGKGEGGTAIDVGTGSGAIAIALALEAGFERVVGTDVSRDALDVARANAQACGARVEFVQADLLGAPALAGADGLAAVVCNPPYIRYEEARELPRSVRDWEPAVALFSPGDGLALTARLVSQAASMLQDGGLLALEVDARRASLVAELVARNDRFTDVSVELDLSGRERFVLAVAGERRRSGHG